MIFASLRRDTKEQPRATPPIRFLFIVSRFRPEGPKHPASQRRTCPLASLRLCKYLMPGLAPNWIRAVHDAHVAGQVYPTLFDADNSSGSLPVARNSWRTDDADSCGATGRDRTHYRCRIYDCRRFPNSHTIGQFLAFVGESILRGFTAGRRRAFRTLAVAGLQERCRS